MYLCVIHVDKKIFLTKASNQELKLVLVCYVELFWNDLCLFKFFVFLIFDHDLKEEMV